MGTSSFLVIFRTGQPALIIGGRNNHRMRSFTSLTNLLARGCRPECGWN
jgi:hypothetical protein